MATATTIKFGDGLDVTDEGAGVIRVDAGAAVTVSAASLSFINGDTLKRFTITDAAATSTCKIVGSITRPTVTDANDLGWTYLHTIVSRAAGTFDLLVAVFDWNEPAGRTRPNETVIFHYLIA